jgi:hypothetical protein
MRTIVRNVSLGGLLVLGSVGATLSPSAVPAAPSAAWLAGCWAFEKGDRIVEESWMPERGGVMLGMSRTSVAGQVREHEFVVLRAAGSALEYHVFAGSQPEVVFRAASPTAKEAVFENPAHDFPKRVGYRLVSSDSLEAWIDGGAASGGKKTAYPYHRVDCRRT